MQATESAALATRLSNEGLLDRVSAVVGAAVTDPLNNQEENVALRGRYALSIVFTHNTVFAFNDYGVCAALKTYFPDAASSARRVTCIAVASMWTPALGIAYRKQLKNGGSDV